MPHFSSPAQLESTEVKLSFVRTMLITSTFVPLAFDLIEGLPNHLGVSIRGKRSLGGCTERRPPNPQKILSFSSTSCSRLSHETKNYLGWK